MRLRNVYYKNLFTFTSYVHTDDMMVNLSELVYFKNNDKNNVLIDADIKIRFELCYTLR